MRPNRRLSGFATLSSVNHHSREAENRPVEFSRLSVSAVVCLLLGSCALDEALPVTWNFSFDCKQDASRTQLVELQVAKGGCPIRGAVVFETSKSTWASPGSRPQGLPAGLYAFQGTARDANGQPIASHCTSVQLPAEEAIAISLRGVSACGSVDPGMDGGPGDGGPADTGTPDTGTEGGPPDDGSVPDAGIKCPPDSGTPDMDQDGDGTPDCLDKCPVDPNKVEPGMCLCNPKTTMTKGSLAAGEYLCGPRDDSVRFAMEADGQLHLRVGDAQVWVSNGSPGGGRAAMQGDGNLVIYPLPTNTVPKPASTWSSNTVYFKLDPVTGMRVKDDMGKDVVLHDMSLLTVNANGKVTISHGDKVVWTVP